MTKTLISLYVLWLANPLICQSFPPAPGQLGSTAIYKDSSIIQSWAVTCAVTRGPKQIDHPEFGLASHGVEANGVGAAEGNSLDIVSLGDGGVAVLTFNPAIKNGPGFDFAVFENGFMDHYMEFAFVEVSSNGLDFYRFPAVSETSVAMQLSNADFGDCAYIHNLAGKYRQGFGTPFDLQDLDSIVNLDLNAITHIRLIDVVGSINPAWGTMDFYGNVINDPWPTNFESSGFDLDGIAVLHIPELSISEHKLTNQIYPNPFDNQLFIENTLPVSLCLFSLEGKLLYQINNFQNDAIDVQNLKPGVYFLSLKNDSDQETIQVIKN